MRFVDEPIGEIGFRWFFNKTAGGGRSGDVRGSQEEIEGLRFSVFFAQEGFVRRVFQQAAHQVGHPREELSHRGVIPYTSSGLASAGLRGSGVPKLTLESAASGRPR